MNVSVKKNNNSLSVWIEKKFKIEEIKAIFWISSGLVITPINGTTAPILINSANADNSIKNNNKMQWNFLLDERDENILLITSNICPLPKFFLKQDAVIDYTYL